MQRGRSRTRAPGHGMARRGRSAARSSTQADPAATTDAEGEDEVDDDEEQEEPAAPRTRQSTRARRQTSRAGQMPKAKAKVTSEGKASRSAAKGKRKAQEDAAEAEEAPEAKRPRGAYEMPQHAVRWMWMLHVSGRAYCLNVSILIGSHCSLALVKAAWGASPHVTTLVSDQRPVGVVSPRRSNVPSPSQEGTSPPPTSLTNITTVAFMSWGTRASNTRGPYRRASWSLCGLFSNTTPSPSSSGAKVQPQVMLALYPSSHCPSSHRLFARWTFDRTVFLLTP